MNSSTSKYARWYARIVNPKVIDYTFVAKGETIYAQKYERVLVSQDPAQYMLGLVPFAFNDCEASKKAFVKFTAGTVLDSTSKPLIL